MRCVPPAHTAPVAARVSMRAGVRALRHKGQTPRAPENALGHALGDINQCPWHALVQAALAHAKGLA